MKNYYRKINETKKFYRESIDKIQKYDNPEHTAYFPYRNRILTIFYGASNKFDSIRGESSSDTFKLFASTLDLLDRPLIWYFQRHIDDAHWCCGPGIKKYKTRIPDIEYIFRTVSEFINRTHKVQLVIKDSVLYNEPIILCDVKETIHEIKSADLEIPSFLNLDCRWVEGLSGINTKYANTYMSYVNQSANIIGYLGDRLFPERIDDYIPLLKSIIDIDAELTRLICTCSECTQKYISVMNEYIEYLLRTEHDDEKG